MRRTPLVSVIVPTFNRAHCVGAAIRGALDQADVAVEIVVVDDGSTDGTERFIGSAFGGDARVRYFYQPNAGVSAARNRGLNEARGDFIAFLDSDDRWMPGKLALQLNCLRALPHAGMIWSDMTAVDASGQAISERYLDQMYSAYDWFDREVLFERCQSLSAIAPERVAQWGNTRVFDGDIYSQMFIGNLVHTSTVVLSRARLERVGGFDVSLRRSGEDFDFHWRTCGAGPVAYVDTPTIYYQCGRDDQLTVVPQYAIDIARNFVTTIEGVLARDRARLRLPAIVIDAVRADAYAWLGRCHLDRNERREARAALRRSLRIAPTRLGTIGGYARAWLPTSVDSLGRSAARTVRSIVHRSHA